LRRALSSRTDSAMPLLFYRMSIFIALRLSDLTNAI
jgi:hypothetical protein